MRVSILLASLVALVSAAPTNKSAPVAKGVSNIARDLQTLQAFAKTVTLDPSGNITTWKGNDPCKFGGVVCADRPDGVNAVAGIDFNTFGMKGRLTLTGLLDKLTDLAFFHANSNGFTGSVPDLSGNKYIYELDVSNNKLSGSFPENILTSTQLTFVDIRYNEFTGPIPAGIFKQQKIDFLFLNNNKFTGTISPEIGSSAARYISLANNDLSGPVPKTLGNLKNVVEALFFGNKLTGGIPEELCAKKSIEVLDFSNNLLTEPLGPKCLALKKAGILNVSGNKIEETQGAAKGLVGKVA